MAAKRARVSCSPDSFLKEIREVKVLLGSIKTFTSQLNLSKLAEAIKLKEGKIDFDPAAVIALMFGYETITWIMTAICHVPKAFERRKNLRSEVILEIVNLLCPDKKFTAPLLNEIVSFIEEFVPHCSTVLVPELTRSRKFEEALRQLTKKGGLQYGAFISPPVTECSSCGSLLCAPNPPSSCTLYTCRGPKPATKLTLRCQGCKISYGMSMTTQKNGVSSYYSRNDTVSSEFIEVTNVVYMEKKLYCWIPSLINHCFVSFEGFSVSYNEVFYDEIKTNFEAGDKFATEQLSERQDASTGFSNDFMDSAIASDGIIDGGDNEISCTASSSVTIEKPLKNKAEKACMPGELSRKSVAAAFWEYELYGELMDMDMAEKWVFNTDANFNNFCGSKDAAVEFIVRNRVSMSYGHECFEGCQSKGCGKLYVLDGNWKLCYSHCMYPVPVIISGYEKEINYPAVCPRNPKYGLAFCDQHFSLVERKGIPVKLKPFLEYCNKKNKDPEEILKDLDKETSDASQDDAAVYQGTRSFMANNKNLIDDCEGAELVSCNKDTVGKRRLQKWSRGIFIVATAGGYIEYWQPLYKSESPSQAFMITIVWLYNKFLALKDQGMSDDKVWNAMKETVLAYDNMCHLNSLKAARKDLPLPHPFDKMWHSVIKVIDRLHLNNHKDPSCKVKYNPDDVLSKSFNTMAAEQVNIWASRLKRIMVPMPYVHHMFFFHRMVKKRNAYTQLCYKIGKQPVVPKSAKNVF